MDQANSATRATHVVMTIREDGRVLYYDTVTDVPPSLRVLEPNYDIANLMSHYRRTREEMLKTMNR